MTDQSNTEQQSLFQPRLSSFLLFSSSFSFFTVVLSHPLYKKKKSLSHLLNISCILPPCAASFAVMCFARHDGGDDRVPVAGRLEPPQHFHLSAGSCEVTPASTEPARSLQPAALCGHGLVCQCEFFFPRMSPVIAVNLRPRFCCAVKLALLKAVLRNFETFNITCCRRSWCLVGE